MIEKLAYEFEIQSDNPGDDSFTFLAIKIHAKDDSGWFNLYFFDSEDGSFRMVESLGENLKTVVPAAIDWLSTEYEIPATNLRLTNDGGNAGDGEGGR